MAPVAKTPIGSGFLANWILTRASAARWGVFWIAAIRSLRLARLAWICDTLVRITAQHYEYRRRNFCRVGSLSALHRRSQQSRCAQREACWASTIGLFRPRTLRRLARSILGRGHRSWGGM